VGKNTLQRRKRSSVGSRYRKQEVTRLDNALTARLFSDLSALSERGLRSFYDVRRGLTQWKVAIRYNDLCLPELDCASSFGRRVLKRDAARIARATEITVTLNLDSIGTVVYNENQWGIRNLSALAVRRKSRLATQTDSERLSRPALETFFRITDLWKLSGAERQKLLGVPPSTYFKYRANPSQVRLQRDTLERISYIIGIYKSINILLPRPEAADSWVRRPNVVFQGHSALEVMLGGNVGDLYSVRHYLDGERGW